jgi:hypothetical protein
LTSSNLPGSSGAIEVDEKDVFKAVDEEDFKLSMLDSSSV